MPNAYRRARCAFFDAGEDGETKAGGARPAAAAHAAGVRLNDDNSRSIGFLPPGHACVQRKIVIPATWEEGGGGAEGDGSLGGGGSAHGDSTGHDDGHGSGGSHGGGSGDGGAPTGSGTPLATHSPSTAKWWVGPSGAAADARPPDGGPSRGTGPRRISPRARGQRARRGDRRHPAVGAGPAAPGWRACPPRARRAARSYGMPILMADGAPGPPRSGHSTGRRPPRHRRRCWSRDRACGCPARRTKAPTSYGVPQQRSTGEFKQYGDRPYETCRRHAYTSIAGHGVFVKGIILRILVGFVEDQVGQEPLRFRAEPARDR